MVEETNKTRKTDAHAEGARSDPKSPKDDTKQEEPKKQDPKSPQDDAKKEEPKKDAPTAPKSVLKDGGTKKETNAPPKHRKTATELQGVKRRTQIADKSLIDETKHTHFDNESLQVSNNWLETRQQVNFSSKYERMRMQNKQLLEELKKLKSGRVVNVASEDALYRMLKEEGVVELDDFGSGNNKTISNLFQEMTMGYVVLEKDIRGLFLVMDVVYVRFYYRELILVETHEQMSDGRVRSRNYLPHVKKLPSESCEDTVENWMEKELGLDLDLIVARSDYSYAESENDVSASYPMRCFYRRHEISYEIPPEQVLSKNDTTFSKIGLPGGHPFTTTDQVFNAARHLEKEKEKKSILKAKAGAEQTVDVKKKRDSAMKVKGGKESKDKEAEAESAKAVDGESAKGGKDEKKQSITTQSVQTPVITISVQNPGLPGAKEDENAEEDREKAAIHFYAWYKTSTLEAFLNAGAGQKGDVQKIDLTKTIDVIFGDHKYRNAYQTLLLQMFGQKFEAQKLCGGFSGSVVLRVQPYDLDGTPEEQVIVKLDVGESIREEFKNSMEVYEVLADRAAKVLGEPLYVKDRNNNDIEMGAFKLELAGACWQVPEFANSSSNLLSTFKDLFTYETIQSLIPRGFGVDEQPPFGNIQMVITELVGSGGMMRAMRKHGAKRDRAHIFSMYNLKGKDTDYNPFFKKDFLDMEMLTKIYCDCFGEKELPDARKFVRDLNSRMRSLPAADEIINMNFHFQPLEKLTEHNAKRVQDAQELPLPTKLAYFRPLTALGHGDLNANNVMIDAMDAVWIIDFATSKKMPLCNDLAKIEVALQFEYTIIPVTCDLLLHLAGGAHSTEEDWNRLKVHDWLGVPVPVCTAFLEELSVRARQMTSSMGPDAFSVWTNAVIPSEYELERIIRMSVKRGLLDKAQDTLERKQCLRQLRSRLCQDSSKTLAALRAQQMVIDQFVSADLLFKQLMDPASTSTENHDPASTSAGNAPHRAESTNHVASAVVGATAAVGAVVARNASAMSVGGPVIQLAGPDGAVEDMKPQPSMSAKVPPKMMPGNLVGKRLDSFIGAHPPDAHGAASSGTSTFHIPQGMQQLALALTQGTFGHPGAGNVVDAAGNEFGMQSSLPINKSQALALAAAAPALVPSAAHALGPATVLSPAGAVSQRLGSTDPAAAAGTAAERSRSVGEPTGTHRMTSGIAMPGTRGAPSRRGSDTVNQQGMESVFFTYMLILKFRKFFCEDVQHVLKRRVLQFQQRQLPDEEENRSGRVTTAAGAGNHDSARGRGNWGKARAMAAGLKKAQASSLVSSPEARKSRSSLAQNRQTRAQEKVEPFVQQQYLYSGPLNVIDGLSLQLHLPILREAYRILGYRDIPPWHKLLAVYYCIRLVQRIDRLLDTILDKDWSWANPRVPRSLDFPVCVEQILNNTASNAWLMSDQIDIFDDFSNLASYRNPSELQILVHYYVFIKVKKLIEKNILTQNQSKERTLEIKHLRSHYMKIRKNFEELIVYMRNHDAQILEDETKQEDTIPIMAASRSMAARSLGDTLAGRDPSASMQVKHNPSNNTSTDIADGNLSKNRGQDSQVRQEPQGFKEVTSALKANNMLYSYFPFGDPMLCLLKKIEFRVNDYEVEDLNTVYVDLNPAVTEMFHSLEYLMMLKEMPENRFWQFLNSSDGKLPEPGFEFNSMPATGTPYSGATGKLRNDESAGTFSQISTHAPTNQLDRTADKSPVSNRDIDLSKRDIDLLSTKSPKDGLESNPDRLNNDKLNNDKLNSDKLSKSVENKSVDKTKSNIEVDNRMRVSSKDSTASKNSPIYPSVFDSQSTAQQVTQMKGKKGQGIMEYFGVFKIADNKHEYAIGSFALMFFPEEFEAAKAEERKRRDEAESLCHEQERLAKERNAELHGNLNGIGPGSPPRSGTGSLNGNRNPSRQGSKNVEEVLRVSPWGSRNVSRQGSQINASRQGSKNRGEMIPTGERADHTLRGAAIGASNLGATNSLFTSENDGKVWNRTHSMNIIVDRQCSLEMLAYLKHLDKISTGGSSADPRVFQPRLKIDLWNPEDETEYTVITDTGAVVDSQFLLAQIRNAANQADAKQSGYQGNQSMLPPASMYAPLNMTGIYQGMSHLPVDQVKRISLTDAHQSHAGPFATLAPGPGQKNPFATLAPSNNTNATMAPKQLSTQATSTPESGAAFNGKAEKEEEGVDGRTPGRPKPTFEQIGHIARSIWCGPNKKKSKDVAQREENFYFDLRLKFLTGCVTISEPVFCYGPGDRIAIVAAKPETQPDSQPSCQPRRSLLAVADHSESQRLTRHRTASLIGSDAVQFTNSLTPAALGGSSKMGTASNKNADNLQQDDKRRSLTVPGTDGAAKRGSVGGGAIARRKSMDVGVGMTRSMAMSGSPQSLKNYFGMRRTSRTAFIGGTTLYEKQPVFQEVTVVDLHPEDLTRYVIRHDQQKDDLDSWPVEDYYLLGSKVNNNNNKVGENKEGNDKFSRMNSIEDNGAYFVIKKLPSSHLRSRAGSIPPEQIFDPAGDNHRAVLSHRYATGTRLNYLDHESGEWHDVEVLDSKLHFMNTHFLRLVSGKFVGKGGNQETMETIEEFGGSDFTVSQQSSLGAREEEDGNNPSSKGHVTPVDGGNPGGDPSVVTATAVRGSKTAMETALMGSKGVDYKKWRQKILCRDMNSRNHLVTGGMSVKLVNEEAQKLKSFMKARYGYIIDSISGTKLDVLKDCANFRLFSEADVSKLKNIPKEEEVEREHPEQGRGGGFVPAGLPGNRTPGTVTPGTVSIAPGTPGAPTGTPGGAAPSGGPLDSGLETTNRNVLGGLEDGSSAAALRNMFSRVRNTHVVAQSPQNYPVQAHLMVGSHQNKAKQADKQKVVTTTSSVTKFAPDNRMTYMVNLLTREFYTALQRNEGKTKTCSFIVKGAPGSGKSCLIRRLIVHTLNSDSDIMPVFISLSDFAQRVTTLIKGKIRSDANYDNSVAILRLEEMFTPDEADDEVAIPSSYGTGQQRIRKTEKGQINLGAVHLTQEYLKLLHGEESPRYIFLKKAITCLRVMFLFDHDATGPIPFILQRVLLGLATMHHRLVVTCRNDSLEGSELLDAQELFTILHIQPLDASQQKTIITARFGSIPQPPTPQKNSVSSTLSTPKTSVAGARIFRKPSFLDAIKIPRNPEDRRNSEKDVNMYSAKDFMNFLEEFERKVSGSALEDGGIDVLKSPTMLSIVLCYWQVKMKKKQQRNTEEKELKQKKPIKPVGAGGTTSRDVLGELKGKGGVAGADKSNPLGAQNEGEPNDSGQSAPLQYSLPPDVSKSQRRGPRGTITRGVAGAPVFGAAGIGAGGASLTGDYSPTVSVAEGRRQSIKIGAPVPGSQDRRKSTQIQRLDARRPSMMRESLNGENPGSGQLAVGRRTSMAVGVMQVETGSAMGVMQAAQQAAQLQHQKEEDSLKNTEKNSVSDVFRVAIDVLVQRMKPLSQQANRFKLKERQRLFHRALQHIAFRLQVGGEREWTRDLLSLWLADEYLAVWDEFSGTIDAGQVALISAIKKVEGAPQRGDKSKGFVGLRSSLYGEMNALASSNMQATNAQASMYEKPRVKAPTEEKSRTPEEEEGQAEGGDSPSPIEERVAFRKDDDGENLGRSMNVGVSFNSMGLAIFDAKTYYKFTLYAFQKFLAAHFIGDSDLYANRSKIMDTMIPSLQTLMENQFWGDVIEVLLEKWPNKFIQIVTSKWEDWIMKVGSEAGINLIHAAAALNHTPICSVLKELPLDIQQCVHLGTRDEEWTPLHIATIYGNKDIAVTLVEFHADIFAGDQDGISPLVHACMKGRNAGGATKVLLDNCLMQSDTTVDPYQRLNRYCNEFCMAILEKTLSEPDFLAQLKRRFPELNYFMGPTNVAPDDLYGSPYPGFICNYYIQSAEYGAGIDSTYKGQSAEDNLKGPVPMYGKFQSKKDAKAKEKKMSVLVTPSGIDSRTIRSNSQGSNAIQGTLGSSSTSLLGDDTGNGGKKNRAASMDSSAGAVKDGSQFVMMLPAEIEATRTWNSMQAVYWVMADKYEKFTAKQLPSQKLAKRSWVFIQHWVRNIVNLSDVDVLGTSLSFLALKNLGKVKNIREDFHESLTELTDSFHDENHLRRQAYLSSPQNFHSLTFYDFNIALEEILVVEKYAHVMPSYMRLKEECKQLLFLSVKMNFNFGQFMEAECLPFQLLSLKELVLTTMQLAETNTILPCEILDFYSFQVFCDISGILGARSLEGSQAMTEQMFRNFKCGYEILSLITTHSAREVYDAFLGARAEGQGLEFQVTPTARAIARLCCLCRCFDPIATQSIMEAFNSLQHSERQNLIGYLNQDGIEERPGFLVCYLASFFYEASCNPAAGIFRAIKLLLRVYELVELEYYATHPSVISVSILDLVNWAQKCTDAAEFEHTFLKVQKLPLEKSYRSGTYECVVKISKWRLFSQNSIELERLGSEAASLCRAVLEKEIDEEGRFIEEVRSLYPELSYFEVDDLVIIDDPETTDVYSVALINPDHEPRKSRSRGYSGGFAGSSATTINSFGHYDADPNEELYRRTLSMILSTFWIVADDYESFVQAQTSYLQLRHDSWENLRKWAMDMVGLSHEQTLDTFIVLATIHLLCGMPNFRRDFALKSHGGRGSLGGKEPQAMVQRVPSGMRALDTSSSEYSNINLQTYQDRSKHYAILFHILENYSSALPSFSRLDDRCKKMIKDVIKVDFDFSQFLTCESAGIQIPRIKKVYASSRGGGPAGGISRGSGDSPTNNGRVPTGPTSVGIHQQSNPPASSTTIEIVGPKAVHHGDGQLSLPQQPPQKSASGTSAVSSIPLLPSDTVVGGTSAVTVGGDSASKVKTGGVLEEKYKSLSFYLFYLFMNHCASGQDSETLVDGVPSMTEAEYSVCEIALQVLSRIYEKTSEGICHEYLTLRKKHNDEIHGLADDEQPTYGASASMMNRPTTSSRGQKILSGELSKGRIRNGMHEGDIGLIRITCMTFRSGDEEDLGIEDAFQGLIEEDQDGYSRLMGFLACSRNQPVGAFRDSIARGSVEVSTQEEAGAASGSGTNPLGAAGGRGTENTNTNTSVTRPTHGNTTERAMEKARGLILEGCGKFLVEASRNSSVEILSALKTLLKVFDVVNEELENKSIDIVDFSILAEFARQYRNSGGLSFNMIGLDLTPVPGTRIVVITPRPWVPVSDPDVLTALQVAGKAFAQQLLMGEVAEPMCSEYLNHIYPELGYFSNPDDCKTVTSSLMSLYFLIMDDYRGFIRTQSSSEVLSKYSWHQMQTWLDSKLGFPDDAEYLDALMSFIAIQDICRIRHLKNDLAPDCIDKTIALAHILEYHPLVLPSYWRLPDMYKLMIKSSVSVGFDFNDFLEAENLPGNFNNLRCMIEDDGERTCGFYVLQKFAQACGKKGYVSMTEKEYKNFKRGLDAVTYLQEHLSQSYSRDIDVVFAAYDSYLQRRGVLCFTTFVSKVERAIVRLACLARAYDFNSGKKVKHAFERLYSDERQQLTRYLNQDGISERPGFHMQKLPDFLEYSMKNPKVGMLRAIRLMLQIFKKAQTEFKESMEPVIILHLTELVEWAQHCDSESLFESTVFSISRFCPSSYESITRFESRLSEISSTTTTSQNTAKGRQSKAGFMSKVLPRRSSAGLMVNNLAMPSNPALANRPSALIREYSKVPPENVAGTGVANIGQTNVVAVVGPQSENLGASAGKNTIREDSKANPLPPDAAHMSARKLSVSGLTADDTIFRIHSKDALLGPIDVQANIKKAALPSSAVARDAANQLVKPPAFRGSASSIASMASTVAPIMSVTQIASIPLEDRIAGQGMMPEMGAAQSAALPAIGKAMSKERSNSKNRSLKMDSSTVEKTEAYVLFDIEQTLNYAQKSRKHDYMTGEVVKDVLKHIQLNLYHLDFDVKCDDPNKKKKDDKKKDDKKEDKKTDADKKPEGDTGAVANGTSTGGPSGTVEAPKQPEKPAEEKDDASPRAKKAQESSKGTVAEKPAENPVKLPKQITLGPDFLQNIRAYCHVLKDLTGLHVTTSAYSIWRKHGFDNSGGKVIPAFGRHDPTLPKTLRSVHVFFFDDNLEFSSEKDKLDQFNKPVDHYSKPAGGTGTIPSMSGTGGNSGDPGICSLRDLHGNFISFAEGQNGFRMVPYTSMASADLEEGGLSMEAEEGSPAEVMEAEAFGSKSSLGNSSSRNNPPSVLAQAVASGAGVKGGSSSGSAMPAGAANASVKSDPIKDDTASRGAALSPQGTPLTESNPTKEEEEAGNNTTKAKKITDSKTFGNTMICYSTQYNVTLVRANLLDALMDDQYFTNVIRKFSRPGEKCMIHVDINATIIFGDLIANKDEAHVLTSAMFEGITVIPSQDCTFKYLGQEMALKGGQQYFAKKMVRQMFSKEQSRRCFNTLESRELLNQCFAVGEVSMGEKLITLEDFERLYANSTDMMKRTIEKGLVRSWFELHRQFKEKHVIMLNTFGVDSLKVLDATLDNVESGVNLYLVNYNLWSENDRTKFKEQYTASRKRESVEAHEALIGADGPAFAESGGGRASLLQAASTAANTLAANTVANMSLSGSTQIPQLQGGNSSSGKPRVTEIGRVGRGSREGAAVVAVGDPNITSNPNGAGKSTNPTNAPDSANKTTVEATSGSSGKDIIEVQLINTVEEVSVEKGIDLSEWMQNKNEAEEQEQELQRTLSEKTAEIKLYQKTVLTFREQMHVAKQIAENTEKRIREIQKRL